jgi:DNA (cytosine-5)-methyltransferase 1
MGPKRDEKTRAIKSNRTKLSLKDSFSMKQIISLFSGCGGLDLGFEQAYFQSIVAYDLSHAAVETYNSNRGKSIAIQADLAKLSATEMIQEIEKRRLTLGHPIVGAIGGPPCQAFSRGNVHPKLHDARRKLPIRYAEILRKFNQEYGLHFFVFENVEGVTLNRHKEEFAQFRQLFEYAGFNLFEAILNAKDYGVPQDRPRMFLVGLNKSLYPNQKFIFPAPVSGEVETVQTAFEEAFGTLPWPEPAFYSSHLKSEDIPHHPNHWTMVPRSPKFKDEELLNAIVRRRSFKVLKWDKPSWTVAYGNREIHVHPSGTRRLSIYEALILQGFPKSYILKGNLSQQVKMVSDAVPPPVAFHLATSISNFLESYQVNA